MSEWTKVVTQPLGLAGLALFLVFGYLARATKNDARRWLSPAAVGLALIALVGGLLIAYKQVPQPAPQPTSTVQTTQPTKQSSVTQQSTGPGSPNVQGVQGDVTITVDQSTGKTETKKTPKKLKVLPKQSVLTAAVGAFDKGTIAYHPPTQMVQNSTDRFELLVSRKPDAGLAGKLENAEHAVIDTILTSTIMGATLDGPKEDFYIAALGGNAAQEQSLSGTEPAHWEWNVTALTAGDHDLDLTVYIKVRDPGTDTAVSSNVIVRHSAVHVTVRPEKTASVASNIGGFIARNWDKLWTLILLPIAGWCLRRWRKRRIKDKGTPVAEEQKRPENSPASVRSESK